MNNNYTGEYSNGTYNVSVGVRTSVLQFSLYQTTVLLQQVWTPFLLLLGGAGNVATIFVLRRTKDHNSSQHVFLIALAVTDLCCLCTDALPKLFYYGFNANVWRLHSVTCKLYIWLRNVTFRLSAWLVTAVTVQRTLAVTWPHKIRVMCTVRRTWTVVAALVFIACALYADRLVMRRLRGTRCVYYKSERYRFYIHYIDTWLTLSVGCFLPFACLLVCDVILSMSLFRATSVPSVAVHAMSSGGAVQGDNSRRETARRTTITILALSISFFILTLPLRVFEMWYHFRYDQVNASRQLAATMIFTNRLGFLLVSTNSAINFFLYCFTGTRFRREFLSWIRCGGREVSSRSVGNTDSGSPKRQIIKEHDSRHESRLTRT